MQLVFRTSAPVPPCARPPGTGPVLQHWLHMVVKSKARRAAGTKGGSGAFAYALMQLFISMHREPMIVCHGRMAAPAAENNGMEFKKRARPDILEEEKKDPEDDEPDFG